MGHFIANKSVQKLFKIGNNLALTTAGLVGHAQSLARTLAAEVSLFELKRNHAMTVKGAATLTANILSGRTHWVQLLIVGVDDDGPSVYSTIQQEVPFQMYIVLQVPAHLTCTVCLKTGSKKT